MAKSQRSRTARVQRHARVREKVRGSCARPRLCVFRSSEHIYAQIVDDDKSHTLTQCSSLDKEIVGSIAGLNKTAVARAVGEKIASRSVQMGVTTIVFDRGGFLYHGRVKALAEGARAGGLVF